MAKDLTKKEIEEKLKDIVWPRLCYDKKNIAVEVEDAEAFKKNKELTIFKK
jgi:hypothetical protein